MEPKRPEPVFNIPAVVLAVLAVMAVLQLWRGTLTIQADFDLVARLAFVPGRLTFAVDPVGIMRRVAAWNGSSDPLSRQQAALAGMFLRRGGSPAWTVLSYAFLHGGWTHLGLNGLWMLAFGTPVARRFGAARFLAFMAVAAVWGAVAHWISYPFGFAPVIGASAAVSGLMGAAVRFMFQYERGVEDPRTVAPQSLVAVFRDRRALSFIVVWFVTNSLFGAGSLSFGLTDAPVAWQAHVGGFVAGLLLFTWFDPVPPAQVLTSDTAHDPANAALPD